MERRRGSARSRWSATRRRPLRRRRRRARWPLPPRAWAEFLATWGSGRRSSSPGAHRGLAGAAGVGAAATAGLAVGIAGGAAYGLARGTGWVLENTLFRPQQGSEDAAVQDVQSANNMNDATQPQHFTLRSGSSTSGSPASVCRRSPTTRCAPSAPVPELAGELQFRAVTPEPASAQL